MSICGDRLAMNPRQEATLILRSIIASLVFVSVGCAGQIQEDAELGAISVHETAWNPPRLGKTLGPIQFRYRVEEHDDQLFKLKVFARSVLGDLNGWKIDLVEPSVTLSERTSPVVKSARSEKMLVASRYFEFRLKERDSKVATVRVEVPIGGQLASRTFRVELGLVNPHSVNICQPDEPCERTVPATLQ